MPEVVQQLSERLARRGHEVHLATASHPDRKAGVMNGVTVLGFDIGGNMVRGMTNRSEQERYQDLLRTGGYDVVTLFAAQQWATDLALPMLDDIRSRVVFVPTGFSALQARRYRGYYRQMEKWMRQTDLNVFLSSDYRDINFARKHGVAPERTVIIPNGAGEDEFLRPSDLDIRGHLGLPSQQRIVLHVGSHTGVKGHREAIEIFRRSSFRDTALLLVGNRMTSGGCHEKCLRASDWHNFSARRRDDGNGILIRELSRELTVAAYHAADLFLFPSNIECSPIVLFEAMASRTPFLASDAGNAAEIAEWSGGGRILPTRKERGGFGLSRVDVRASVAALEELMANDGERARLGESGFKAWRERFSWERIAERYEAEYRRLVEAAR
jgi:glycosyltransferase involved in cell wall biosynthesis